LLDGQAVHAIKGERAHYQPVKSILCDSPDPLAIARAFRDCLGLHEIYVADLNAIQGFGRTIHRDTIAALANSEKMEVILDAGISDVESAQIWINHGVRKVVIGSETLHTLNALQEIPARIGQDRLAFSLDFRAGKILSQCASLAAMPAINALKHLQQSGWREVILLDLSRVGSSQGADRTLAASARKNIPDLQLLVGGGIANPDELNELKSAAIAGVLVATALHAGIIDVLCISRLAGKQ